MPMIRLAVTLWLAIVALCSAGCGQRAERLEPRSLTWAELRTVRRSVVVAPPGEAERAPYPK